MTPKFVNASVCLLACSLLPLNGMAQTVPLDRANQEAERIQRQEQQRLKEEREKPLQERPKSALDPNSLSKPGSKAPALGAECRDTHEIVIQGAAHLPADERQKIIAPYLGKCLGVAGIERLLSDLTQYYVARGYITTRVYLPSQDLSSGKLELLVLEGVIEQFLIRDGGQRSIAPAVVFPGLGGQVLNLRDIEQGLDQINRLSSNDAKMQILPGSKPGSSVVAIDNAPKRWYKFNASYDNQGSEGTGKHQLGVGVALDNALGWNDFFNLTHREAVPGQHGRRFSASDSVAFALPYGYYTVSLNGSHSRYESVVHTPAGRDFGISGNADLATVKLDKLWYRNQKTRFMAGASLTLKDTKNYLAGELLSVSSRKLSVLDIDSNLTTGLAGGVLGLDLGYARGLNGFGALRDGGDLPSVAPHAQFGKLKYGATWNLPFKLAGLDAGWSSNLSGQRALDTLYGSEQILIGGIYSVRGFVNTTLSGDHGFTWRNDVSLRYPFQLAGQVATLKPYVAFDYGQVSQKTANGQPSGSLSGAALGSSLILGPANWEVFVTRPLHVPAGSVREGNSAWFRLSLSI